MSAKLFSNLILNSNAFLSLKQDATSKNLAHAYLLIGADMLASKLTAQMFSLFCLDADFKSLADFNADMHFVGTKAADIDAMLEGIFKAPSKGEKKFYIIAGADTLSTICQNKLLKTLEEPPSSVCVILCAKSESNVVAPVLSRCRKVNLEPFSSYDIANELTEFSGADEKTVSLAASLSKGNLEQAEQFILDKNRPIIFNKTLEALLNTKTSKDVLAAVGGLIAHKDGVMQIVDAVATLLRDALMLHIGAPALVVLKNLKQQIQELSALYSIAAIEKIMPFLNRVKKRNTFNANHNSLIDELVFTIAALRHEHK